MFVVIGRVGKGSFCKKKRRFVPMLCDSTQVRILSHNYNGPYFFPIFPVHNEQIRLTFFTSLQEIHDMI